MLQEKQNEAVRQQQAQQEQQQEEEEEEDEEEDAGMYLYFQDYSACSYLAHRQETFLKGYGPDTVHLRKGTVSSEATKVKGLTVEVLSVVQVQQQSSHKVSRQKRTWQLARRMRRLWSASCVRAS